MNLEEILSRHQHEISAIEAVSTFAAVVVSLVLTLITQRTSRTRLKAYARINIIMHSTMESGEYPHFLTTHITNMGIMPVSIPMSFFHWKVPFRKGYWLVTPLDYAGDHEWVPQNVSH